MRYLWSFLALVICTAPYVIMLMLALAERWAFPHLLPEGWTFARLRDFAGGDMGRSLLLSLVISLTVAIIATPFGCLAAKWIAFSRHRRRWLMTAYAPYAFSPVILGATLMFGYIKLGLDGRVVGVILAQSMFALAFAVVFFTPFWTPQKRALEELVYTLGGTRRQAFTKALWPVSRDMVLICYVQTFLISWAQYGLTLLIGAGKVQTLPLKVYAYVNEANPFVAALASLLLMAPPALLLLINKRALFSVQELS